MITEEVFLNAMNSLSEIYSKDSPGPEAQKIYFMIFQKNFKNDNEFMNATLKVMETRVFTSFPKPSEFLECLKNNENSEIIEIKAINGAMQIKEAVRKYGIYANVTFDDPLINLAIKNSVGGWIKLCRLESKEFEKYIKWEFPKAYQILSGSKNTKIPIYLEGLNQNINDSNGFRKPVEISYIGDENRCKKWISNYFEKHPDDEFNENKFIALGYKKRNELLEAPRGLKLMSREEVLQRFCVNTQKPKLEKIERSKDELIKMLKAN